MKKVRQFESLSKQMGLDKLTITTNALNLGLIDEKGNPTPYAFKINITILANEFGFLFDIKSFEHMCECERVKVAIRCYFMALPGIPNVSLEPIKKQIIRASKRVPREKAMLSLAIIVKNTEKNLMDEEHYEDLQHWQGVKTFILDEAEKVYGEKLNLK